MKSTLEIIDILYQTLKTSSLKSAVNGGLYKLARPDSSEKEDIVINCLPSDNFQMQTAVVNVNVYVKDLNVTINGKRQFVPDTARMKALAALAITDLGSVDTDDYFYGIVSQGTLQEEVINQHFLNLRIEFTNVNN